jgi:adenylate kinase
MNEKIIRYGDFFLDVTKKRKIRKLRKELRESNIEKYQKLIEQKLPIKVVK